MVCEMEPGMGLGVHGTMESCQVSWGNDRVVCAQVWSQRAGPPHCSAPYWLYSLVQTA